MPQSLPFLMNMALSVLGPSAPKLAFKLQTPILKVVSTSLFVNLKRSTCETRKYISCFTSKALFVLEIIKF